MFTHEDDILLGIEVARQVQLMLPNTRVRPGTSRVAIEFPALILTPPRELALRFRAVDFIHSILHILDVFFLRDRVERFRLIVDAV